MRDDDFGTMLTGLMAIGGRRRSASEIAKATVDTTAFDDLQFGPSPNVDFGGERAVVDFANGYGASVVRGPYTYGGAAGLYELAVIKREDESLVYTTPITNDVLGHLSPEDVTRTLGEIARLPPMASGSRAAAVAAEVDGDSESSKESS